jgi:hypothetical protein
MEGVKGVSFRPSRSETLVVVAAPSIAINVPVF